MFQLTSPEHMAAYVRDRHEEMRRVAGEARMWREARNRRRRSLMPDRRRREPHPVDDERPHRVPVGTFRVGTRSAGCLHLLGCVDAEQAEAVGQHPGRQVAQRQATVALGLVVGARAPGSARRTS